MVYNLERILAFFKIEFGPLYNEEPCWIWTRAKDSHGYGQIKVGQRQTPVHRIVYRLLVGEIPLELQIDHLCRNRACCNPAHLELVTPSENSKRRGPYKSQGGRNFTARTACSAGHEYVEDSYYINKLNHRVCRVCAKEKTRRLREKKKEDVELK